LGLNKLAGFIGFLGTSLIAGLFPGLGGKLGIDFSRLFGYFYHPFSPTKALRSQSL